jgi:hypothetical protein
VDLWGGILFVRDADLSATLKKAGVEPEAAAAGVDETAQSRINGLQAALGMLALIALALTRPLPTVQPGEEQTEPAQLDPRST